jgi:hypothetical protein
MSTSEQLRAARAIIRLDIHQVAALTGLQPDDITLVEDNGSGLDTNKLARLRSFYESHGLVFLMAGQDDPAVGPGLRIRTTHDDDGVRPENLSAANDG